MEMLVDFLLNFYGPTPYAIIFLILLACGLGLPIPEDITLFAAGLMAYYGVTHLGLMIGVALLGVVLGDLMIFLLGRHFGRKLTSKGFFHSLLPDERLDYVKRQFNQRGLKFLFMARFMPGLRAPVYFSAGTLHVPLVKFLIYDGLAALISVPTIIGLVYRFGDNLDLIVTAIKRVEHGIFLVIGLIALAVLFKWYVTHRKLKRA